MPDDCSISAERLRERIAQIREAGERLDKVQYCGGRLWLADYAGNVDVVADCLEELLDQGIASVTPYATRFAGWAKSSPTEVVHSPSATERLVVPKHAVEG